ncbi:MAG: hypothetical protein ACJ8FG_11630 [Sphingomicrobium sp.]
MPGQKLRATWKQAGDPVVGSDDVAGAVEQAALGRDQLGACAEVGDRRRWADFAGRLIEQAGLKGTTRGGAQISDRHANFIVNLGRATAANVVELIALARAAVLAKSGVELKPEVRLVGDFDPPLPPDLEPHHHQPAAAESAKPRTGVRP